MKAKELNLGRSLSRRTVENLTRLAVLPDHLKDDRYKVGPGGEGPLHPGALDLRIAGRRQSRPAGNQMIGKPREPLSLLIARLEFDLRGCHTTIFVFRALLAIRLP